jgi:hypothetical protein
MFPGSGFHSSVTLEKLAASAAHAHSSKMTHNNPVNHVWIERMGRLPSNVRARMQLFRECL